MLHSALAEHDATLWTQDEYSEILPQVRYFKQTQPELMIREGLAAPFA